MNTPYKKDHGFTLFELLITLLLISLTLTLVSPNLFNTLAGTEQKTMIQHLHTDLAELRLKAFLLEQPLQLKFSDGTLNAYQAVNEQPIFQRHYPGIIFQTDALLIGNSGTPAPKAITLKQHDSTMTLELKPWP